ncbi:MAG: ATP synthase F1 subunit gamma [Bernardetiaceae bacterium]
MPNLKEVRSRITSVSSTQQITRAMKMVAAAKLRKAQNRIMDMRPYARKLNSILENVVAASEGEGDLSNPYSDVREPNKILIVVITSDRGLCGAFNSNVIRHVQRTLIAKNYAAQEAAGNVHLMCIGKRGLDAFKRTRTVIDTFSTVFANKDMSFDYVRPAAEFAMQGFVEKRYDRVLLVYNEFKNVATQVLQTEQFLPIVPPAAEQTSTAKSDYIFEPDQVSITENLIPKSLKIQFYKAVLESNASEHGARMTAMDQATENAGELLKQLRLTYNQTRQAYITKEILEIVGGAQALSESQ